MRAVFPHVYRFGDKTLVASNEPLAFDREAAVRRLVSPGHMEFLRPILSDAVLRQLVEWVGAESLVELTHPNPRRVNEDLFPRDEYWLNQ